MGFAAAQQPQSHTSRLLETDAGTVYILRETVDMEDFKSYLWLAVLVHKSKQRAFEAALGKAPLTITEYGKTLLRSAEPITVEQVQAVLAG
jgi:hypothetical protein